MRLFVRMFGICIVLLLTFNSGCKNDDNPATPPTTVSSVPPPSMVQVAGGTFTAGSTPVTISDFKIDKYEVTYELWHEVILWGSRNNYYFSFPMGRNGYNPAGSNNPVTEVSWYDVVKWCNARSVKDGLTPVYYTSSSFITANVYKYEEINIDNTMVNWSANGYRLPTEAEWEFAAKGGTQAHVPPFTYSGSNTIGDVAWYAGNSPYDNTTTVGTKSANELGIYDMSGSVWEWCWDWYSSAYPSGSTDPKGPSTAQSFRLLRGGSFNHYEIVCRAGFRYSSGILPFERNYIIGFRCVQKKFLL